MSDTAQFRSLIYGKYRSMSDFSAKLGWTRQKMSRIVSGKQCPTLAEVRLIAEALDVQFERVANIFLP